MGSSDIASSHDVRTGFSLTCSRLSRYLRGKKGSLGNVGLALNPHRSNVGGTTNLLSAIGSNSSCKNKIHGGYGDGATNPAKNEQMAIFYGGRVLVFDELPADKAQEIVKFARELGTPIPRAAPERAFHSQPPPLDSDLPIARKKSLARFLEKRKEGDIHYH